MPYKTSAENKNIMVNFFTRLLRPAPETLLAPKAGGTHLLIEIRPLEHFPNDALLQLPAGCSASFFQGKQRSRVFIAGSHHISIQNITPLDAEQPMSLVYLWKNHTPARHWQTKHQCPQTAAVLELSGEYSYRAAAETRFFDYLLAESSNRDLSRLDSRISTAIRALLARQAIPAADIRRYPERLSAYLRDALSPLMQEIGLEPIHFSLAKADVSEKHCTQPPSEIYPPSAETAADTKENQDTGTVRAEQPAYEYAHNADTDTNSNADSGDNSSTPDELSLSPLPPEPKEYYCAAQGTQLGPFNSADLQTLIHNGTITKRTLLWKQGMTSWQAAHTLPQLYWNDKDSRHENT